MDDRQLLNLFGESQSQDAFRQLVDRHLPMVYSAARRMVHDSHLAEEVAQNVFTALAQKAESIRPPQVVSGWLYNTTRHFAMHAVRGEQRRREREQTAVVMQALDFSPDDSRLAEHLEPAMAELDADDRDALVLRYLENRPLRDVGAELGISEDAARMRVNRAIERLRTAFQRRDVTVTAVLLATAMTASTGAVPVGLGAAIATASLATVTTATLAQTAVITVNWLNAKAVAVVLGAAVLAGSGTYLAMQQRVANADASARAALVQQEQLTSARDEARAAAQAREQELESLRKEVAELPRLRGEVTRLRGEAQELTRLKAAYAQQTDKLRVAGIIITNIGPRTVDEEQVRANIHIKIGSIYSRVDIDREVRNLYASGLFSNIRISEQTTNEGVILTYHLEGKSQPIVPGQYISKDQLAFAGYATPEAALQSITWNMMVAGDYDRMLSDLNAADRADEAKDPKGKEQFEAGYKTMGALFKGMQILARKTISDERVELKVKLDSDPYQNKPTGPGIAIQPMLKVGDEWKLGGNTHQHSVKWDQNGSIQTYNP